MSHMRLQSIGKRLKTVVLSLIFCVGLFAMLLYFCSKEKQRDISLVPYKNLLDKRRSIVGTVQAPSVLLKPKGGLGNQLFLFACSYALARKQNWPLFIVTPSSNNNKSSSSIKEYNVVERHFSLDQFNIPMRNTINESWLINNTNKIKYISDPELLLSRHFSKSIIQLSEKDYCQSEIFFSQYKNEIIKMFQPKIQPPKTWKSIITKSESVAVHIRRGDFVNLKISVPLFYIRYAMKNITILINENKSPTFFLFSDDINFVKEKLFLPGNKFPKKYKIHYVSNPKVTTSIEEFVLMTHCKHAIIPNSSFSWWAAYLIKNPHKIIIAANYNINLIWSRYFKWQYKFMYYPSKWLKYDAFI